MATYPAMARIGDASMAPSLFGSASRELERQMQELVPAGKQGAVLTVVDKSGVTIGVAAVVKGGPVDLKIVADLKQKWEKTAPEASLKVQATW